MTSSVGVYSLSLRCVPALLHDPRHPEQTEVCDDHFVCVVEDVLRFEVFVNDAFSVKVTHSLENTD